MGRFTVPSLEIQQIIHAKKYNVKDVVWLTEDVMASRPGAGIQVYAQKGEQVLIMSYDPALDNTYGIRSLKRTPDGKAVETYRNAQVKESQLSAYLVNPDAVSVGL